MISADRISRRFGDRLAVEDVCRRVRGDDGVLALVTAGIAAVWLLVVLLKVALFDRETILTCRRAALTGAAA